VPLTTTDPNAPIDDLEPLRQMVGTAHVVGLGEGTHGTHEFFQMKHRILKFLVTKMGFTHFAIEATSPEADDVNRYVLTGQGDPARLLSRLYFWTWNTQEVADMIAWMREWNRTAPANQQVQFLGFDMQSPGASIDSVVSYIGRVDPSAKASVISKYSCLDLYRNHEQISGERSPEQYEALPTSERAACAGGLLDVHDMINAKQAAYEAASSPDVYQVMLHHARLVQEFEAMISTPVSSGARDAAMAENVEWIREHAGADAKIVLWAHNGHINAVPGTMGGHLRDAFESDYVNLGFAFGHGTLTAVGQTGTTLTGLGTWSASIIPKASIEAVFEATAKPRLLLDTRQIAAGGAAAAPLAGPIAMRSIGAVFNQQSETAYFVRQRFPDDFNLLIYVSSTTASKRLPFIF
jgi:Erythromycin esterase homolog